MRNNVFHLYRVMDTVLYRMTPQYDNATANPFYRVRGDLVAYSFVLLRLQATDPAASTTAYLAALDIHAALEHTTPPLGPEAKLLPADVIVMIFAMLSTSDILHRVWRVSRAWRSFARHPSLWKVQK